MTPGLSTSGTGGVQFQGMGNLDGFYKEGM